SPRPSTATSPPTTTPRPCRSPDGGARPGHYADPGPLAQSVEQRTFNPCVVGSSPTAPTAERRRPARPPAASGRRHRPRGTRPAAAHRDTPLPARAAAEPGPPAHVVVLDPEDDGLCVA